MARLVRIETVAIRRYAVEPSVILGPRGPSGSPGLRSDALTRAKVEHFAERRFSAERMASFFFGLFREFRDSEVTRPARGACGADLLSNGAAPAGGLGNSGDLMGMLGGLLQRR